VDFIIVLLVVVCLSGILSALALFMGLLTRSGAIASFIIGLIIGMCGSIDWLFLLIVFTVIGFVVTKIGLSKKTAKGLQEGKHGERNYQNVLGVGIPSCIFAIMNLILGEEYYFLMSIGYIGTIAVAAADTAASEIGIKDKKVWLITTFKRVEPGVNGGISVMGTFIAFVGAIVTTIIGWLVIFHTLDYALFIPVIAGVIGCMADSVVGATLEDGGIVSKYTNNCLTELFGAFVAIAMAMLLL
jgi:uncharacterized protein (TIGR00297 family)